MVSRQDDDGAQLSEEDYWAHIRAYNADGSYDFPPPPVNADQVLDFWLHVAVSDETLARVQERDDARHARAEAALRSLHTSSVRLSMPTTKRKPRLVFVNGLAPDRLREELDAVAASRRYRRHPEDLEHCDAMILYRHALAETEKIVRSVPPHRIPTEDIRMAARFGGLHYNAERLSRPEYLSLYASEVIFMGRRQRLNDVWHTWRPDLIV
jgi:hypothetical protein